MEDSLINEIWDKSRKIEGLNPDMFRADPCGAIIARSQYGQQTPFGWVVDHIYPQSLGGDDNPANLRAMQWRNNIAKGDNYPVYQRIVTFNGTDNEESPKQYQVNKETQKTLAAIYGLNYND